MVGVRFRRSRRMHLCDAGANDLRPGEFAIVQTSTCPELARVTLGAAPGAADTPLGGRRVLGPATRRDIESLRALKRREVDARLAFFRVAAAEGLFVSAVRADYRFDGKALRFRFRCEMPLTDTRLRERLTREFAGVSLTLTNVGAPRASKANSGCGGGSCGACPSNGLRERSGAVLPRPGLALPGAFSS